MKGEGRSFVPLYNPTGLPGVGIVTEVVTEELQGHGSSPSRGKPNSVFRLFKDGKLIQERYYDEKGLPYMDIDYEPHGRRGDHSKVPHVHYWYDDENGERKRDKGPDLNPKDSRKKGGNR